MENLIRFDDYMGVYTMTEVYPPLETTFQFLTLLADGTIVIQGADNTINKLQGKWTSSGSGTMYPSVNVIEMITLANGDSFPLNGSFQFMAPTVGALYCNCSVQTDDGFYIWIGKIADKLNEKNLAKFKSLFPDNHEIQNVTIDELRNFAKNKPRDGAGATLNPSFEAMREDIPVPWTPCEWAIGMVLLDIAFILSGMWTLRTALAESAKSLEEVYTAIFKSAFNETPLFIKENMPEIEKLINIINDNDSTTWQVMKAMLKIGKLAYSGGMLEAIVRAIMKTLTWWDMILYGVLALAEITAAFLTDGAAIIAMLVAEAALIGFLISDTLKIPEACASHFSTTLPHQIESS